jgi:glycosyltransferase involved in cell wall biosynthesis
MDISVVIPTYNRVALLARCLNSLFHQDAYKGHQRLEIILALDSRDEITEDWAKSQKIIQAGVKIARAQKGGANSARNAGINIAKGHIIFFLDDDCFVPDKTWMEKVLYSFKKDKEAAVIGGKYLLRKNSCLSEFVRNQLDNFYLENNRIKGCRVRALLGGNSGYRKTIFKEYGLFDEFISYGGAETEMNLRITEGGGKMCLNDNISVFHQKEHEHFLSYFLKSFRQGKGSGYIQSKHGSFERLPCFGSKRTWFLQVVQETKGKLFFRLAAGFSFFFNAVFYWGGFVAGFYSFEFMSLFFKKA